MITHRKYILYINKVILILMFKRLSERIQKEEQTKVNVEFTLMEEEQNFSCLLCNETLPTQSALVNHLKSFVSSC